MHYDRLDFIETIKELAHLHSISIKNNSHQCTNDNNKKNLFYIMNNLCTFYEENLKKQQYHYAYKYLKNRGLNDDSIEKFNIGFAPPGWNNILHKFNKLPNDQTLLLNQSGMLIVNSKKKYDRFRERIMFPIKNMSGNIIAFGGRTINRNHNTIDYQNQPKYLNSPDTNIFKKNQCLYGIYEICTKQKNPPHILLVEGYMDVITLTQFGIHNAAASLGTATTNHHIQLLYKITNEIICCYDGDIAGKQAAWRTLKLTLPYLTDNRQIRFIFLPKNEDPDTLIRKIGQKNFLLIIEQAQDISHFLFNILIPQVNLQTLKGRMQLNNLMLPIIKKIPGKTLQLYLLKQLGNKIGILDISRLYQLLEKNLTHHYLTNKIKKHHINHNIKYILLALLIQNPQLSKLIPTTIQKFTQYNQKDMNLFYDLIQICRNHLISTSAQLLEYYRGNKFFPQLEKLAYWNHLITDDMIEITFIKALTELYNSILRKRQNALIAQDRISELTKKEKKELWIINQTLSKR